MTTLEQANRIKARLRACTTVEEVEQVAEDERETVMRWAEYPDESCEKVMSIHIINLKSHMLKHQIIGGKSSD